MRKKIGVGLYGSNGHQVTRLLEYCPYGEIVGYAHLSEAPDDVAISYGSLEEMLRDPRIELVSLCSPRRADQAEHAIACLNAGRHVYAEKPAALSNEALDRILVAASSQGREFHEMADTVFRQPFYALRSLIRSGRLGEVVQVFAQKSYPSSLDKRPQDESIDGGLIRQCAIHAVRMVEHLTGIPVTLCEAIETRLGNVNHGELRMAASISLGMKNGAVASIVANYFNPPGFGRRGNDQVRVFGTQGMAELTDDLQRSRVVIGGKDCGPLDASAPVEPYFHSYLRHLLGQEGMPMTMEEELHPLRVVNSAKVSAKLIE